MDYPVAILTIVLLIAVSIWISHLAEKIIGENDPKQVVIDEICGMAVALCGIPFTPVNVFGGFLLFRIFDIKKPFPIRWVDRKIPGGMGIMMDDIIAGAITNILMQGAILMLT
ncbi:Phosphatidylglycerophosphatase A (fragment) [Desulfosarcina cetonica]